MKFNRLSIVILVFVFILSLCGVTFAQTTTVYWIDPVYGSDANQGTQESPFKTINKAKSLIRERERTENVTVYLNDGFYNETLHFDAKDGGNDEVSVTYKAADGAKPVLGAMQEVSGFTLFDDKKNIYRSEFPQKLEYVRNIYDENGKRLKRAALDYCPIPSSDTDDNASVEYNPVLKNIAYTKNIAQGSKATIDYQSDTSVYPAANLTDGNTDTYILTAASRRANRAIAVKVELEKEQKISEIQIFCPELYNEPADFKVEISQNDSSYETVETVTNAQWAKGKPQKVKFAETAAKYVRITISRIGTGVETNGSVQYRLQLGEIKVMSDGNMAKGKEIKVKSTWEIDIWSQKNINDGNRKTLYTSLGSASDSEGEFVTVNLGKRMAVGGIRLCPRSVGGINIHYPEKMRIEYSDNGTSFKTAMYLQNIPDSAGMPQEFIFPQKIEAAYIRIVAEKIRSGEVTDGVEFYRFQLAEFEIYPFDGENTDNVKQEDTDYSEGADIIVAEGERMLDTPVGYIENATDMEVHSLYKWYHNIYKVTGIDSNGKIIGTDRGMGSNEITWLENAYEFIDEQGEWYIDRFGSIANDGKCAIYVKGNYEKLKVPTAESIITVSGSIDNPVKNLNFEGIEFNYTCFTEPSKRGYIDHQSGTYQDPDTSLLKSGRCAIEMDYAEKCTIKGCTFRRLGGGGILIENASKNNMVRDSIFTDISAGAIYIGNTHDHHDYLKDARDVVKGNTIYNNYISSIGVEFLDNSAIHALYTDGTVIMKNTICHVPYTGISLGWGWGMFDAGGSVGYTTPTCAKDNVVKNNLIYDCGHVLHDGGLIYTFTNLPGTVISENYVHDYGYRSDSRDCGIYLDEGSCNIEISNNAVSGAYWWFSIWTRSIKNNYIHNNIYADGKVRDYGENNRLENNVKSSSLQADAASIIAAAGCRLNTEEYEIGERILKDYVLYPDSHAMFVNKNGKTNLDNPPYVGYSYFMNASDAKGKKITSRTNGTNIAVLKTADGKVKDVAIGTLKLSKNVEMGDIIELYSFDGLDTLRPVSEKIIRR